MNYSKEQIADAIISVEDEKISKMSECEEALYQKNAFGTPVKKINNFDSKQIDGLTGEEIKKGEEYGEICIVRKNGESFFKSRVAWKTISLYTKNLKKGIMQYAF